MESRLKSAERRTPINLLSSRNPFLVNNYSRHSQHHLQKNWQNHKDANKTYADWCQLHNRPIPEHRDYSSGRDTLLKCKITAQIESILGMYDAFEGFAELMTSALRYFTYIPATSFYNIRKRVRFPLHRLQNSNHALDWRPTTHILAGYLQDKSRNKNL